MFFPKSILNDWAEKFSIVIASLALFNYGLLFGWPSAAVVIVTSGNYSLYLTAEEASYFTVLPPITTIITALLVGYLMNQWGRKNTLLFGTVPYFVAWILVAIGGSKWIFYAARTITGIGDGCAICATSLYIGEISQPKIRGTWGNLAVLELMLGIMFSYILGGHLSIAMTAYVCVGFPVLQFLLVCCIPESPYFLLTKNRVEEARKSLQWLRQSDDVNAEFDEISAAVERQMEEPGTYKDILLRRSNRNALIVVLMLRLTQQFSGMSAFIVYSQTIFENAGGNISTTTSPIICGAIQLVFSVVGAMIVDKFGRRKTLFNSSFVSIIILILMSAYFYISEYTNIDVTAMKWFPLAGMIIFLIAFGSGLAVVPTLMSGELFAANVKEKSMAINNMVFAGLIAGTTKIFHVLSEVGFFVPFAFYAATCLVFTIVCYFIVPETKGKTLDEIQQDFESKSTKT